MRYETPSRAFSIGQVADGEYPFLDPESEDGKRINAQIKVYRAIQDRLPNAVRAEVVPGALPVE